MMFYNLVRTDPMEREVKTADRSRTQTPSIQGLRPPLPWKRNGYRSGEYKSIRGFDSKVLFTSEFRMQIYSVKWETRSIAGLT
ncbi:hypothetical protein V6N13_060233 [Hibiscus sabdariffa]